MARQCANTQYWTCSILQSGLPSAFSTGMAFDGAIVGGSWNVRRRYRKVLRGRWTVELSLDAGSVARLAAEHFLERGFEHYAFVEPPRFMLWANERREAYRSELAARGIACAVYRPPSGGAYDVEARRVLAACRIAGLGVPEDIAVLGVDNDLLRCETALPALSSVAMGGEEAGLAAAAALDAALRGRTGTPERIVLGGVRVEAGATRSSRRCGRSSRRISGIGCPFWGWPDPWAFRAGRSSCASVRKRAFPSARRSWASASPARRTCCGRRRSRARMSPPRSASATRAAAWRTSSGASSAPRRRPSGGTQEARSACGRGMAAPQTARRFGGREHRDAAALRRRAARPRGRGGGPRDDLRGAIALAVPLVQSRRFA